MRHTVDSVQLSAPEVVTAEEGGSVTISCQYVPDYRDNKKYWCRGQVYELCQIVVKTPKYSHRGRTSITDDKVAGVFTVTMTSIRESDEGKYWCVIARPGRNVYSAVSLQIDHTGNPSSGLAEKHQTRLRTVDEVAEGKRRKGTKESSEEGTRRGLRRLTSPLWCELWKWTEAPQ
ncbi:CMRF35-like molecule 5 [Polymixia lowei]